MSCNEIPASLGKCWIVVPFGNLFVDLGVGITIEVHAIPRMDYHEFIVLDAQFKSIGQSRLTCDDRVTFFFCAFTSRTSVCGVNRLILPVAVYSCAMYVTTAMTGIFRNAVFLFSRKVHRLVKDMLCARFSSTGSDIMASYGGVEGR